MRKGEEKENGARGLDQEFAGEGRGCVAPTLTSIFIYHRFPGREFD